MEPKGLPGSVGEVDYLENNQELAGVEYPEAK